MRAVSRSFGRTLIWGQVGQESQALLLRLLVFGHPEQRRRYRHAGRTSWPARRPRVNQLDETTWMLLLLGRGLVHLPQRKGMLDHPAVVVTHHTSVAAPAIAWPGSR